MARICLVGQGQGLEPPVGGPLSLSSVDSPARAQKKRWTAAVTSPNGGGGGGMESSGAQVRPACGSAAQGERRDEQQAPIAEAQRRSVLGQETQHPIRFGAQVEIQDGGGLRSATGVCETDRGWFDCATRRVPASCDRASTLYEFSCCLLRNGHVLRRAAGVAAHGRVWHGGIVYNRTKNPQPRRQTPDRTT